jgi:hypothetical protein
MASTKPMLENLNQKKYKATVEEEGKPNTKILISSATKLELLEVVKKLDKECPMEDPEFELGDKYKVACRSEYHSTADSASACIAATKDSKQELRAVFEFEVYKGEVLKAEVNLHKALVGTTMDKDGKTNGEIQPESDGETRKNIREIQEVMKAKKSDWQVVSVIPIKEYEEAYQKAGEEGDYLTKWGGSKIGSAPTATDIKRN